MPESTDRSGGDGSKVQAFEKAGRDDLNTRLGGVRAVRRKIATKQR